MELLSAYDMLESLMYRKKKSDTGNIEKNTI